MYILVCLLGNPCIFDDFQAHKNCKLEATGSFVSAKTISYIGAPHKPTMLFSLNKLTTCSILSTVPTRWKKKKQI